MSEDKQITYLKISIVVGLLLLLAGHVLLSYTDITQTYGPIAMACCAALIALGLVFSLPTKMYLTFLLVKREQQNKKMR
ncbi:hypothetical protein [Thalassotalea maritima]|uniref:hypothetical protein n=1 Tax=Thalassotalea maritima TaxID=3242416 RepID=UPI003528C8A5